MIKHILIGLLFVTILALFVFAETMPDTVRIDIQFVSNGVVTIKIQKYINGEWKHTYEYVKKGQPIGRVTPKGDFSTGYTLKDIQPVQLIKTISGNKITKNSHKVIWVDDTGKTHEKVIIPEEWTKDEITVIWVDDTGKTHEKVITPIIPNRKIIPNRNKFTEKEKGWTCPQCYGTGSVDCP